MGSEDKQPEEEDGAWRSEEREASWDRLLKRVAVKRAVRVAQGLPPDPEVEVTAEVG